MGGRNRLSRHAIGTVPLFLPGKVLIIAAPHCKVSGILLKHRAKSIVITYFVQKH